MKPIQANIVCRQVEIPEPCPKTWRALTPTQSKQERFCTSCQETVYLCLSEAERLAHAEHGRCVAIPRDGFTRPEDDWMNMTQGRAVVVSPATRSEPGSGEDTVR